ncbi:MAG TPA: NnrS family protein [Rhodocyclaceae bacterium]|nr:NnrS family protein [Rhodocyclaceae bacterium]
MSKAVHMRTAAPVGPLWTSAFRPFFLLGTGYGLVFMLAWAGAYAGAWELPDAGVPLALWHGHEMIHGFSTAIVVGVLLTALPSWAGTPELRGAALGWLAVLWGVGRAAVWGAAWLPPLAVMVADALLVGALLVCLAPQLVRVANRFYLWLLPVLLALLAANLAYHLAVMRVDFAAAASALRAALYGLIVLYALTGGILTSIFTGNALREKGRGDQARLNVPLEVAALATVLVLALADLAGASRLPVGIAALACALVHAWRVARWRGWRVADVPLVLPMHLGFAWLIAAFALKALAELTGWVPEAAWVHAFTVGALGMMMIGLMLRVSLRHTGRPLVVPGAMRLAGALMLAAAFARLAATVHGLGAVVILLSALAWLAAFAIYLRHCAPALIAPSLPRGGHGAAAMRRPPGQRPPDAPATNAPHGPDA